MTRILISVCANDFQWKRPLPLPVDSINRLISNFRNKLISIVLALGGAFGAQILSSSRTVTMRGARVPYLCRVRNEFSNLLLAHSRVYLSDVSRTCVNVLGKLIMQAKQNILRSPWLKTLLTFVRQCHRNHLGDTLNTCACVCARLNISPS